MATADRRTTFFTSFRQIADLTRELPGNVGLTFLSIKPSPARWYLIDAIRHANQMIKTDIATRPSCVYVDIHTPMLRSDGQPRPELFADDGLHLSPEGYSLWKSILSEHADTIFSHKI